MKKNIFILIVLCCVIVVIGCSQGNYNKNNIKAEAIEDSSKLGEKASIKNIKSKDFLKLQLENDKFIFYSYDCDIKCLEGLSKLLDNHYDRICNDLKVTLKEKVVIKIYPDIETFHIAIDDPNAPEWVAGVAYDNTIQIVSPLNSGRLHNSRSIYEILVHEFTHIASFNINSDSENVPLWLLEGVATYEAGQKPGSYAIKKSVKRNSVPSISQLSYYFLKNDGYSYAYTIIEYLAEGYGFDTIISMIKEPEKIPETLGVSMEKFEDNWINFLSEKYNN